MKGGAPALISTFDRQIEQVIIRLQAARGVIASKGDQSWPDMYVALKTAGEELLYLVEKARRRA